MKIVQLTTDNREPFRQCDLATPFFGTAPEALLQGFAEMREVEVHVIACAQQPMKSPAKLAENIFFHSLHVPKLGWMRTGYQGCVRAVRRKVREIAPDIVHGQGTERENALSAVFSGFPNVVTIHGNMAGLARHLQARVGSFMWLAGRLEDFTLPRTAGVFCNSAYTESLVLPRNPRIWRVPNAVRLPFFAPCPERAPSVPPRLLNIGVISARKRQVELLALFRRLHEAGHRGCLDFIGTCSTGDPYGAAFLRDIRSAEAAGYARYSGSMEVGPLLAEMDCADGCLHFPTEESFGLVVAETLARNLKFFGAAVGGIPEIARAVDGVELFAPEDWGGLESALVRWMEGGAPRPTQAAEVMADRYHPRRVAERHLEIYREVLATS